MTTECMVCKKEIEDYDPKYCCSAFDCGCRGLPVEPPICSSECWDQVMEAMPR